MAGDGGGAQAEELKRIVFAVGAELRRARYDAVEPVARARTAVVKCVDPHAAGGELACDVRRRPSRLPRSRRHLPTRRAHGR